MLWRLLLYIYTVFAAVYPRFKNGRKLTADESREAVARGWVSFGSPPFGPEHLRHAWLLYGPDEDVHHAGVLPPLMHAELRRVVPGKGLLLNGMEVPSAGKGVAQQWWVVPEPAPDAPIPRPEQPYHCMAGLMASSTDHPSFQLLAEVAGAVEQGQPIPQAWQDFGYAVVAACGRLAIKSDDPREAMAERMRAAFMPAPPPSK